ncbi:uncharacterized protein LOC126212642 [Schistocerca nitens]|uniref:uncharacterized protein LOC126212642 n=1 Tax=Schistocerca nitens TaxID=7011 RepID=UPI002118381B|nr:uncharacterized protein LOC126212642 [Schistocerca nitens]
MEWNMTTLQTDDLRHHILSQSVHAVRRITKAMASRVNCEWWRHVQFEWRDKHELQAQAAVFRERLSSYWRDLAQLLSLDATLASQLLVPLAFERMGNHASDQQLHGWIKDMERVKDTLRTKLTGWVHDMQLASKQVEHYEVEEDKDRPGHLIIRQPLLSERLLRYQPWSPSFDDDFSALCEERQPEASQMFSLADDLYTFHRVYWYTTPEYIDAFYEDDVKIVDEEWQLEDRSHDTLSVNTDCVQLLVNALDHPTCPLEDLPLEAVKQREQCREQLWDDVVQRSPHVPVTSYLAYTQRINVNLCLLAWMAVNSYGICQDVPFSMIQSVHDARCYFDSPDDQSCRQSNATDAICSVSRAILLLKCRDFSSIRTSLNCVPDLSTAVLIDSALTLLSCIWLNSFCYQMYSCVRHLRLPNQLLPAEVSQLFCREVLYVLIPWRMAVRLDSVSPLCLTPQERAAAFSLGGGGQSRHGAHWGRLAAHPHKRPAPPGHA